MSPRAELVSLLRGYFACPVLAALADLGLTKRMRAGRFAADDLAAANRPALLAALRYLQSLGLIEPAGGDTWRATPAGEYVLDRGRGVPLAAVVPGKWCQSSCRGAAPRNHENGARTGYDTGKHAIPRGQGLEP